MDEKEHEVYAAALAVIRAKYFADFPTGLTCVCGAEIIDHARGEKDGSSVRSAHEQIMGPGPTLREQIDSLSVYHSYWCGTCGLLYRDTVIETIRGYIPLEKRQPIPRSCPIDRALVFDNSSSYFKGDGLKN